LGVNARHRTLADFTGGGDWEAMVAKRDAPVPMESNRSG
jgi:hypothetical protein